MKHATLAFIRRQDGSAILLCLLLLVLISFLGAALLNGDGVKIPLVVHGGTGLAPDVVRRLVSLGGAKFNVSTDLKHTWIDACWSYLQENREQYNTGKLDIAAKEAIREKIKQWIILLGSDGKA